MRPKLLPLALGAALIGGPLASAAAGAPLLSSLRLPATVEAQQGHARFLVGIRLAEPARLTVQVIAKDGSIAQGKSDTDARPAGRAYLRIDAVDNLGYQLPAGRYKLRIQALSSSAATGTLREKAFTLKLTPPHGRLDVYTVPLWKAVRSQNRIGGKVNGQFVAVAAPKGPASQAGIRSGDLITKIGDTVVDTPGAWETALRALAADTAVTVTYLRNGRQVEAQVTPKADWEPEPNYAGALANVARRSPKSLTLAFAQVRQQLDANDANRARTLLKTWSIPWRRSALGQFLDGEIFSAGKQWKQALGAYNRAAKLDPRMAIVDRARGITLLEMGKPERAIGVLAAGERSDPKDAELAGYQGYAFLRAERNEDAALAAQRAVRLDPLYGDGFLPLGIALLAQEQRAPGLKALRRGLLLIDDGARADRLIAAYLNPADP
ncbi:MAG TPA: PDZ domain-containing protein [Miltoncostaeaceae bacterium]|nr:PDZ domain-containing protein [Miltoncostaeaceae bacterium]